MKYKVQYKAYRHYMEYKRVQQKYSALELLNSSCQNQNLCTKIGVESERMVNFLGNLGYKEVLVKKN